MSTALSIGTRFTAIDRFTPVVKSMEASMRAFCRNASTSFERVQRAERKLSKGIDNLLGSVGKLGFALGGLLLINTVVQSNIKMEQSMASLQAITGVSSEQMKGFGKEVERVAKSQKRFSADVAQSFEMVGSAMPELLLSADALGAVSEQAIILGKAGKLEVSDAVNSLTVSMNQFGASAEDAAMFVDILATAQQKGSGNIQYLSEAMVNSGSASRSFGNSFEDTVAILEGFAKASIPASTAGNAFSAILSQLSKSTNKDFNPQFTKATDILDNLSKANLKYGDILKLVKLDNAKYLQSLINQNVIVQQLSGNLNETGNAQSQANIQTNTLGERIKELTASFQNAITTTNQSNVVLNVFKGILGFVADNMGTLVGIVGTAVAGFIALKATLIAVKIATVSYSIWQGVAAFATGKGAMALRTNTIALGAYKIAQWAANAALLAFPLTWIIVAIVAVVAGIVALVKNWKNIINWIKNSDNVFAKLIRGALLPIKYAFKAIGVVIGWLSEQFSALIDWFKTSDNFFAKMARFLVGTLLIAIRAIGYAISWLGDQFSVLWEWIKKAADAIWDLIKSSIFGSMGVDVNASVNSGDGVLNTDAAVEQVRTERIEKTKNEKIDININDATGKASIAKNESKIPVKLTPTMGS